MRKLLVTFAMLAFACVSWADEPANIERVYKSSDNYWTVLFQVDEKSRVKCACFDSNGELLMVKETVLTPPYDSFTIGTYEFTDAVVEVKCWTSPLE